MKNELEVLQERLVEMVKNEKDSHKYIRHTDRSVSKEDIAYQTKLAELTNKINYLKYGPHK